MCLATIYVENDAQKNPIMRDVAWITPTSAGLELITLLGESKLFQASIKSIDLVNGSIVLEMNTPDRVRELEQQIAEIKSRWPAHSPSPTMLQQLDELEQALELEKSIRGAQEQEL